MFDPAPKFSYKADELEEWLADFDEFHITTKGDKEEESVQKGSLLYFMGAQKAWEIYNNSSMGKYVFRQLMDVEQKTLMRETMTAASLYLNLTNISSRRKTLFMNG